MKRTLEDNQFLEVVGVFSDAASALECIEQQPVDIVFSDIEMPHSSGIDFARSIEAIDDMIQVVFVTAHDSYALEAFEVSAAHYLLKPVTPEALNTTINRLMKNQRHQRLAHLQATGCSVFLLGDLSVSGKTGERVKWPTAKSCELFAYLIDKNGNYADKWKLCEALWPNADSRKAENNLYSTVNRVKTALANAGIEDVVFSNEGRYRIDLSTAACDAWSFKSFLESTPFVNANSIFQFERTLDLYKGPLYGNNSFYWALDQLEWYNRLYKEGILKTARYYIDNRQFHKGEQRLRTAISLDPCDETILTLLLQCLFEKGNKPALIGAYRRLKDCLEIELESTPSRETQRLYHHLLIQL